MRLIFFISIIGLLLACNQADEQQLPSSKPDSTQLLREALQYDSSDIAAWMELYQRQLAAGDTNEAMVTLADYVTRQPRDLRAKLDLAWLFADQHDPRALPLTDSLALLSDRDVSKRALFIRGLYYGNTGAYEQAMNQFDEVILQDYHFIDAYIEKGIILYDLHNYADALKVFQQALTVDPSTPEIYYWISSAYEGMGKKEEAADWLRKFEALK